MQMGILSAKEDSCSPFEQFADLAVLCLIYAVKLRTHTTY